MIPEPTSLFTIFIVCKKIPTGFLVKKKRKTSLSSELKLTGCVYYICIIYYPVQPLTHRSTSPAAAAKDHTISKAVDYFETAN